MFGTIVLGFDESHHAERAAGKAVDLAKALGDRVIVVHVQPLVNPGRGGPLASEEPAEAHHVLDAGTAPFSAAGVEVTGHLQRGPVDRVGEILIDIAHNEGAGLIVVGTRGRSDAASMVFGSVAHHVIHHSDIPVLVVRDTETH